MNKLMRKFAVALIVATMATTTTGVEAYANDGMGIATMDVSVNDYSGTGYIVSSTANVRTAPSTDYRILDSLSYGEKVYLDGYTSNGWYRIETTDPIYGGLTSGYIYGDLVSTSRSQQYEGESSSAYTVTVNVASGYLALRNSPNWTDDDSNVIEELYNGQTFTVTENHGQYLYGYSNSTGRCGYVNGDYVY